ncbi:MAG: helix-turn-helix domain-containing protein [Chthoniobacterales bacterium]
MRNTTTCNSLGRMLADRREVLAIPIEQAAKDTRIRLTVLRGLEQDDFSFFAHPSYARFFILDYARYLGIDPVDIELWLPVPGNASGEGLEYIENLTTSSRAPAESFTRPQRGKFTERSFSWQGLAALFLIVLLLGVGGGVYFLRSSLLRLEALKLAEVNQEQQVDKKIEADSAAAAPAPAPVVGLTNEPEQEVVSNDTDLQFLLNDNTSPEVQPEVTEQERHLTEMLANSSMLLAAALPLEINKQARVLQNGMSLAVRETAASYSPLDLSLSANLSEASTTTGRTPELKPEAALSGSEPEVRSAVPVRAATVNQ